MDLAQKILHIFQTSVYFSKKRLKVLTYYKNIFYDVKKGIFLEKKNLVRIYISPYLACFLTV
jgi:hypothetical protein